MAKKKEIKTAMPAAMKEFRSEMFGELTVINFDEAPTEPWFILNEVCGILGYANPRKCKSDHLNDDVTIRYPIIDALGRTQHITILNEEGLFRLIMHSQKKEAETFQHWVCGEVLPMIRRTGAYITDDVREKLNNGTDADRSAFLDEYNRALKALVAAQETIARLQEDNRVLKEDNTILKDNVAELSVKAAYYDEILSSDFGQPITSIAGDFGLTAQKLHKILNEEGVIYKKGTRWYLTKPFLNQDIARRGKNPNSLTNGVLLWSEKGREFIDYILKRRKFRASFTPVI